MCAIVGGIPMSPYRPGVMVRVKERHAYVDPKHIEDINMTGMRTKKYVVENLYGRVRVQGPRFLSV